MESIRRFSTFLVGYARDNRASVVFPDDGRRKKRQQKLAAKGKAVPDAVCPVCGQGQVLESAQTFFCSRLSEGCHFTLWKDCLTRGGGPEMTDKLVQLLLRQKQLRGSTGTIVLDEQRIAFYPIGSNSATVSRSVIYHK